MKTTLLAILVLLSTVSAVLAQGKDTLEATFETVEDGTYYFVDADGFSHGFDEIADEVLKLYNLMEPRYQGKTFVITFDSDVEDDDEGEDIMVLRIIGLRLVE